MNKLNYFSVAVFVLLLTVIMAFNYPATYPIDGYASTGIARLAYLDKLIAKDSTRKKLPKGAYAKVADIKLNLISKKEDSVGMFLKTDAKFQSAIDRVFPDRRGYSATILNMTNPDSLQYAAFNEKVGYQPGSVGKLAVITALFTQLQKLCPNSWDARTSLLKNKSVSARYWGTGDHHTIPVYDREADRLTKRRVVSGDTFTLYEWADHMLSVSNNGAASVVWREALLMAAFGNEYEGITEEEAETYFKETPRSELTDLANDVVNLPLRKLGITEDEWRLGSFFTGAANKYVGDKGGSIGTPLGLMKYLVQLEQGNVIDKKSSLEIKRLMYMTDRRIRYAYSPRLGDAAVYFKSGSFYKCDREKNPGCKAYAGNVYNYMNSVIIVEQPNGVKYIVCLMTNVLGKNSAGDHMYLATGIDKVINPTS